MKKESKAVILIVIFILASICLSGCISEGIVGKWKMVDERIEYERERERIEQLNYPLNITPQAITPQAVIEDYYLQFYSDGTCKAIADLDVATMEEYVDYGEWSTHGNILKIVDIGEEEYVYEYEIKGNHILEITSGPYTLILERVN